eukprot:767747-Hanusia_phi.AAC.5
MFLLSLLLQQHEFSCIQADVCRGTACTMGVVLSQVVEDGCACTDGKSFEIEEKGGCIDAKK